MASEEGALGKAQLNVVPPALLAFAVILALVCLSASWFSVDTRVQVWHYDRAAPDGKGNATDLSLRIATDMKPLSLATRVSPVALQDALENSGRFPSYDREFGRTGTQMLGIFLLSLVAFLALLCVAGSYYLQTRRRRDHRPTLYRMAGLFGGLALLSAVFLAATVPTAAREDTKEQLQGFQSDLNALGYPSVDPRMLSPNVRFWNTWICCPPDTHYPVPGNPGQEYLIVVTTKSHPAAGFWLSLVEMGLVAGALVTAHRAGQLAPPRPAEPHKAVVKPA